MTRFWKNTNTLDAWIPELKDPAPPEEADIAVIGGKPIDLDAYPRLKGLFKCGVGTDNVPFDLCDARGIAVGLPSPGTSKIIFEETAAFAVHSILAMLYARAGRLDGWLKFPRPALNKRQVLIIGLGNIGSRVKASLEELTSVTGFDITTHAEIELEPLMRRADVVSLHIPLTRETRGWMDSTKLSWMRDGAALVNTARGAIVDERALWNEIESGRLRAAFDVFWQEPYDGPLRAFHPDRFLMTPHVASTCEDFLASLAGDLRDFSRTVEER